MRRRQRHHAGANQRRSQRCGGSVLPDVVGAEPGNGQPRHPGGGGSRDIGGIEHPALAPAHTSDAQ